MKAVLLLLEVFFDDIYLLLKAVYNRFFCKCEKVRFVTNIYGDRINTLSGKHICRSEWQCVNCGRYYSSGWLFDPPYGDKSVVKSREELDLRGY